MKVLPPAVINDSRRLTESFVMKLKLTGKGFVHFSIALGFAVRAGAGWKLTAGTSYPAEGFQRIRI